MYVALFRRGEYERERMAWAVGDKNNAAQVSR